MWSNISNYSNTRFCDFFKIFTASYLLQNIIHLIIINFIEFNITSSQSKCEVLKRSSKVKSREIKHLIESKELLVFLSNAKRRRYFIANIPYPTILFLHISHRGDQTKAISDYETCSSGRSRRDVATSIL